MLSPEQKVKVLSLQREMIDLDKLLDQQRYLIMDMSNTFEELELLFDEYKPMKKKREEVEDELKDILTFAGIAFDAWRIPLTQVKFD